MVEDQAAGEGVVGVNEQGELSVAIQLVQGGVGEGCDVGIQPTRVVKKPGVVHPPIGIDVFVEQGVEGGVIERRQ